MIGRRRIVPLLVCAGSLALAACDASKLQPPPKPADTAKPSAEASPAPPPLPAMPPAPPLAAPPPPLTAPKTPADNPLTAEAAALGKQLFFDKRLSKDGSASCETC